MTNGFSKKSENMKAAVLLQLHPLQRRAAAQDAQNDASYGRRRGKGPMVVAGVSRTDLTMSTQWAAQFLVAAELERHGYVVTFTMGHATPVAGHPGGKAPFWVDVKGLASRNSWWGKEKPAMAPLQGVDVTNRRRITPCRMS